MTTTDEQRALLSTILANPDDDTVRLGYADYLDSLDDVRVTCPKCQGSAGIWRGCSPSTNPVWNNYPPSWWDACKSCDGTGTILDTANRDHAELIRLQVELLQQDKQFCDYECKNRQDYRCGWCKRKDRERELTSSPRWTTAVCPGCKQDRRRYGQNDPIANECPTCGGTGDLFKCIRNLVDEYGAVRGDEIVTRPHSWDRGFLIVRARTDEVMRNVNAVLSSTREEKWQPTKLALAWAQVPWVMGVELEEHKPEREEGGWEWYGLPDCLNVPMTKGTWDTPEQATRALSYATMGWIKNPTP